MIILGVIAFIIFVFLEKFSSHPTFGFGANPVALLIFHSIRLGLLLFSISVLWHYNHLLGGIVLLLFILLGCFSFVFTKERYMGFINIFITRNRFRIFKDLDQSCRFLLSMELDKEYSENGIERSTALAIQVVNYLMGDDFNEVYKSVSKEAKCEIDKIKDLIEKKADEKMSQSPEINELICRSITIKTELYSERYGRKWGKSVYKNNIGSLLLKYSDFRKWIDYKNFDKYISFASKFIENRKNK